MTPEPARGALRTRKTVLFVFGTRPEAIKMAPVVRELKRRISRFRVRVCVTAQHREMLDQVIRLFRMSVHHDLNIMRKGQHLGELTARTLVELKKVLEIESPDLVIVQGDTTTTFTAALAAFYEGIPVAHIEAGLRTWDFRQPYPEEMNRVLTSHLATLHFAPTRLAARNLLTEGVDRKAIHVTGNTVIDALLMVRKSSRERKKKTTAGFPPVNRSKRIILVTGHRRESFGPGFREMCEAIRTIAAREPDVEIVYPVHLNPRVQEPVRRILSRIPNVHLLQPLHYEPFLQLLARSFLVLTDSGGVQEEALSFGKPVLVMRRVTERPEGITSGGARLVGTRKGQIIRSVQTLLHDPREYRKMIGKENPYGDGKASVRIARILHEFFPRRQSSHIGP